MLPLLKWFLHGDDVGKRLTLMLGSGSAYVVGSNWRPEDPVWWAGLAGVIVCASASKPNGVAK